MYLNILCCVYFDIFKIYLAKNILISNVFFNLFFFEFILENHFDNGYVFLICITM